MPRYVDGAHVAVAGRGGRVLHLEVAAPHHQVGAEQRGDAIHQLRPAAEPAHHVVVEMAVVVVQVGIPLLRRHDDLAYDLFPQRGHLLRRDQLKGAEHTVAVIGFDLGGL